MRTRQDKNLLGLPSRAGLALRVLIDVGIGAIFTLVLASTLVAPAVDWALASAAVGGISVALISIFREVSFYQLECLLRRRLGYHMHRAELGEQEVTRLKRTFYNEQVQP